MKVGDFKIVKDGVDYFLIHRPELITAYRDGTRKFESRVEQLTFQPGEQPMPGGPVQLELYPLDSGNET